LEIRGFFPACEFSGEPFLEAMNAETIADQREQPPKPDDVGRRTDDKPFSEDAADRFGPGAELAFSRRVEIGIVEIGGRVPGCGQSHSIHCACLSILGGTESKSAQGVLDSASSSESTFGLIAGAAAGGTVEETSGWILPRQNQIAIAEISYMREFPGKWRN
jgi:hypothetical protein